MYVINQFDFNELTGMSAITFYFYFFLCSVTTSCRLHSDADDDDGSVTLLAHSASLVSYAEHGTVIFLITVSTMSPE